MDLNEIDEFCLSLPATERTTPFDATTFVYKVCGRMFLLTHMVDCGMVAVKSEPDRAEELRERYAEVTPAYHMNKRHWNDLRIDGDLPADFIRAEIGHSYDLVVAALPKAVREKLKK